MKTTFINHVVVALELEGHHNSRDIYQSATNIQFKITINVAIIHSTYLRLVTRNTPIHLETTSTVKVDGAIW